MNGASEKTYFPLRSQINENSSLVVAKYVMMTVTLALIYLFYVWNEQWWFSADA